MAIGLGLYVLYVVMGLFTALAFVLLAEDKGINPASELIAACVVARVMVDIVVAALGFYYYLNYGGDRQIPTTKDDLPIFAQARSANPVPQINRVECPHCQKMTRKGRWCQNCGGALTGDPSPEHPKFPRDTPRRFFKTR